MNLRLGSACANGDPSEQVIEVAGGHGLQQLGGHRQAQAQHFTHQFAGQGQAGGHVIAAVQVWIVGQAFPAHSGARFLDVGTDHQQHLVADFKRELLQIARVFHGRFRVVDRARADNHQQA